MKILFYRYGSICEPAIIRTFQANKLEVIEITEEITDKNITSSARVKMVHDMLSKHAPLFVFSINFFPAVAEICHLHKTLYLCWTVDSPVLELFSNSITHNTNRIFLFDRAQYETFAPYNEDCIFHLPLASDIEHYESVTNNITENDRLKYSHDISFIGSLYNEKNPLHKFSFSEYISGYLNGIVEAALKVYGCNLTEELVNEQLINAFKDAGYSYHGPSNTIINPDNYTIAHSYIGMQIAETERIRTLNSLAKHFNVDLYTRSDTTALQNVTIHGGVKTLTEMPKIFHLSKINLNMTIKPIQTGLPLRIFDIMGCGGFLMTNYQAELTEHFTIGTDLDAYSSMDELIDKCAFYLEHDDIRKTIAQNGYEKIRKHHTYQHRIIEMLHNI